MSRKNSHFSKKQRRNERKQKSKFQLKDNIKSIASTEELIEKVIKAQLEAGKENKNDK